MRKVRLDASFLRSTTKTQLVGLGRRFLSVVGEGRCIAKLAQHCWVLRGNTRLFKVVVPPLVVGCGVELDSGCEHQWIRCRLAVACSLLCAGFVVFVSV